MLTSFLTTRFSKSLTLFKVVKNLAYIARADEFIHENEMAMVEQAVAALEMTDKIKLAKTENIHFIGIGGIGMSGLAIIMKGLGFKVQGSDKNFNKNLERLRNNKINYFIGHKKKNILKSTIIVVSSAIPSNNPEIKEAKRRRLNCSLNRQFVSKNYNSNSNNNTLKYNQNITSTSSKKVEKNKHRSCC